MNRTLLSLTLLASLAPAAAFACGEGQASWGWSPPNEVREASVAEVAEWTRAKTAVPVDANGKELRASEGVIPGAVLLSSSSDYALLELPADQKAQLVFYCASERCTASHQAARRALENGYKNVAVLPAGIKGWKAAGQPTTRAKSGS